MLARQRARCSRRCFLRPFIFDLDQTTLAQTARRFDFGRQSMVKTLNKKIMQRTARYGAITTTAACLVFVATLISACDVAQAKSRSAAACGKELQQQCSRVPVAANNMLECLAKARVSARCHAVAQNVVRSCERDAGQFCLGVLAGQGNILGCLTGARGVVSAPCNAALNAAFLR